MALEACIGFHVHRSHVPIITADGVIRVKLRTGSVGRAKAQLVAKGSTIAWPAASSASTYFSQDERVTVQLINNETMTCWNTEFVPSSTKKNTGEQFKAKAP